MIVSVVDGDRAPVTGLEAADFEIREDDAAREGSARRAGRRKPADRHSGRYERGGRADDHRPPARADGLRRGHARDNQVTIIGFGGPPRILVETTSDVERLRDGIGRVFPQSGQAAYLLDAMYEVAEGFTRRGADRPVMVAMTAEGLDYSTGVAGRCSTASTRAGPPSTRCPWKRGAARSASDRSPAASGAASTCASRSSNGISCWRAGPRTAAEVGAIWPRARHRAGDAGARRGAPQPVPRRVFATGLAHSAEDVRVSGGIGRDSRRAAPCSRATKPVTASPGATPGQHGSRHDSPRHNSRCHRAACIIRRARPARSRRTRSATAAFRAGSTSSPSP